MVFGIQTHFGYDRKKALNLPRVFISIQIFNWKSCLWLTRYFTFKTQKFCFFPVLRCLQRSMSLNPAYTGWQNFFFKVDILIDFSVFYFCLFIYLLQSESCSALLAPTFTLGMDDWPLFCPSTSSEEYVMCICPWSFASPLSKTWMFDSSIANSWSEFNPLSIFIFSCYWQMPTDDLILLVWLQSNDLRQMAIVWDGFHQCLSHSCRRGQYPTDDSWPGRSLPC